MQFIGYIFIFRVHFHYFSIFISRFFRFFKNVQNQSKSIQNEHFSRENLGFGVENPENSRNHSIFETTLLHDVGEFANFETCYHYVLRELRSFPGSIRPGNRRTRLEIAGESVFDLSFCRTAHAHRPIKGVH